jgi:hypothetical protein
MVHAWRRLLCTLVLVLFMAALQPLDQVISRGVRAVTGQSEDRASSVWKPQDGPQTAGYYSLADVVGYGGAAGGGKTDLALGTAGTAHYRSIIFRRVFPSVRGIIERSHEIFNASGSNPARDSYNEGLHIWRLADGRHIELASMQYEKDKEKFQGQPHDLYVFDEATEFNESQVVFVTRWNRSTHIDQATGQPQRCQVLLTFNPPFDESGEWVTRWFAPWLDEQHPNPAKDGELRWFGMVDNKMQEIPEGSLSWWYLDDAEDHHPLESGQPLKIDGQWIVPVRGFEQGDDFIMAKSRTFFHATLKDNPILARTGYGATIDATPEPIRSLLKGKFNAAKIADPWQVIPTEWIKLAQARWARTERPPVNLRAVGNDVAHGGADDTVLAPLYGTYFDELLVYPGWMTPRGEDTAVYAKNLAGITTPVFVDAIGYGSSASDTMASWGMNVTPVNFGASAEDATDKSGVFRFANVRAEAFWLLREALDPASGQEICLPPDREVLIDLAAPKYKVVAGRIQIEPKADIKQRIGRSPDKGDAIALVWWGVINGNSRAATLGDTPDWLSSDYRGL